jgi:outer membrane protein assembly factor BamB
MMSHFRAACLPAALLVLWSTASVRAQVVSSPLIGQLGLERAWAMQLRVDPSRGRLAGVQLSRGLLLAHTTQGVVQALDPETGRALWTTSVGRPDYETMSPAANGKFVAIVNGSKLYLLDRLTGGQIWEQRIGGSPAAGVGIDDEQAYVPLDTGIVEAYKLIRASRSDEIPQRYSGTGGAVTAPVVVGSRVLWSVSRGFVYARVPGEDLVQFRFRMDDDASASPGYMAPYVYAASRKGTVYCLTEDTGVSIWEFAAGSSVSHPIMSIDGALYVITERGDMYRLNPQSGVQMWYQRGVARFAAAGGGKLYVIDVNGRLAALDAASGSRLGAVPIGEMQIVFPNGETDRIYLATSTGTLQCLREMATAKPLAHTRGYAIPPKPKPGEPAAADPAATGVATPADGAQPGAAAPANPFGT